MKGLMKNGLILLVAFAQLVTCQFDPTGCCVQCFDTVEPSCIDSPAIGCGGGGDDNTTFFDGELGCAICNNPPFCGCTDPAADNYHPGAVVDIGDCCYCDDVTIPVCGVNGETYTNACFANCADVEVSCQGSCPCDGTVGGDPHFRGFNGGKFDFPGDVGTIYSIISDEHFQLNSRFIEPIHNETHCKGNEFEVSRASFFECESSCFHNTQCVAYGWNQLTHECKKFDDYQANKPDENSLCGVFDVSKYHSFMGDLGILIGTHKMSIQVGIDGPSVVVLDGDVISNDVSLEDVSASFEFEKMKKYRHVPDAARYMLTLPKYKIEIAQKKFHFNIEVEYLPAGPPLPHGALGQTSRWEKACYSELKGSNECIEGDFPDYEIHSGDLFGTDFRYNQYVG